MTAPLLLSHPEKTKIRPPRRKTRFTHSKQVMLEHYTYQLHSHPTPAQNSWTSNTLSIRATFIVSAETVTNIIFLQCSAVILRPYFSLGTKSTYNIPVWLCTKNSVFHTNQQSPDFHSVLKLLENPPTHLSGAIVHIFTLRLDPRACKMKQILYFDWWLPDRAKWAYLSITWLN